MNIPTLKNRKTFSEWVDALVDAGSFSTDFFKIVLFNGKDNETEISGSDIMYTMLHDYGNFTCYSAETAVDFAYDWQRFVRIHTHDFERMYTALYAEYNPIENYNKISTIIDDGETGAPSSAPITSTIEQVADDTVSTANPYIPQNRTTSYGKTENDNTRTENTHGNIGVMTNQSMISDEWSMRLRMNMVETICRAYANMELI